MLRSYLFVPAILLTLGLWFFGPVLVGGQRFACRDAAHFYGPLLEQARDEWAAGRVPLWNPYELAGVPLGADATSSVFYPGKLLFALPLGFGRTYALYIVAHVLLAAAAAYGLARAWGASREGGALAGLSYAFGGAVLFQYANVVYLIGAAWLPAALWAADGMLLRRRATYAVTLGAILALLVLGGDPQMAYHAVLLTGLYALILRFSRTGTPVEIRDAADASIFGHSDNNWRANRLLLLALACVIGLALAAVQVLPAAQFVRRSTRAVYDTPRSIYELPGYLLRDDDSKAGDHDQPGRLYDGLLHRRTTSGTHQAARYTFSVGPWRFMEYVWPGVGGRQFPVHRRWLEVIPAERDPWVPSLYMGLLPLVLGLAAWRLRGGEARQRWMSWTLLVSVLAALGTFSPAWLVRQLQVVWIMTAGDAAAASSDAAVTGDFTVGDPAGGLYWLFGVLLPGYVYFRFPAKWLVVASLAIAMLSARGWDSTRDRAGRSARRLFVASLLALAALLVARPWWDSWFGEVAADPLYGPFDPGGAFLDAVRAFAHTSVIAALAWWLLLRRGTAHTKWAGPVVVLVTAIEIGFANGPIVQTAPATIWQEPSTAATKIARFERRRESTPPPRMYRVGTSVAAAWRDRSDVARPAEAVRWWRDTLWPKFNAGEQITVVASRGTLTPFDYQVFLDESRQTADETAPPSAPPTSGGEVASSRAIDVLGVGYILQTRDASDVQLVENRTALPRAWIVHDVETVPPSNSRDPRRIREMTRRLLEPDGRRHDLRQWALVETTRRLVSPKSNNQQMAATARTDDRPQRTTGQLAESCRIVRYDPLCVELEATLREPGLVVLSDLYYPGWKLNVRDVTSGETTPAEILRTNRIMRGVWLRPGQYRLVYRYRPMSFLAGAAISGVGWILLGALALCSRRRSRRPASSAAPRI